MPRLPRIYIEGAVYFVTCRGEHSQEIFKDIKDYTMFLELLKKYKEQYDIKIFAYMLMPTHLHLLVEMSKPSKPDTEVQKSQEISDFMHNLNNAYTKYFNSRYERRGHLFRERFKAALVEKESYLLKMTVYLHLNPVRLNLVSDPVKYPYSSLSSYLNNEVIAGTLDLRQEVDEVLHFLGDKSYADFMKEMTEEEGEFIHKRLQRGGILGSSAFEDRVRSGVESYQSQSRNNLTGANPARYRIFVTAAGTLLILLSSGAVLFYFSHKTPPQVKNEVKAEKTQNLPQQPELDINNMQWDIKLIPSAGGFETVDNIIFDNGKFTSAKLKSMGYNRSNYSFSQDASGKIAWETIQSIAGGTASWHGELENDKMSGILLLRQEGKAPQDFSFISIRHGRNK